MNIHNSLFLNNKKMILSAIACLALMYSLAANAFSGKDAVEIMRAINSGDTQHALSLIEHIPEAEINNPVGSRGGTLLHSILQARHRHLKDHSKLFQVIDALIMRGVDVNRRDDKTRTVAFYLRHSKNAVGLMKALAKHGADLSIQDQSGKTLLHIYSKSRDLDIVKYLIEYGINLEIKDKRGGTPLTTAAKEGSLEVMKLFVSSGADINIKDKNNDGLIHYAARSGDIYKVTYLLDLGLPINQLNGQGKSALSIFASSRKWSAVRLLLERGANTNVPMRNESSVGLYLVLNPEIGLSSFVSKDDLDVNARTQSKQPPIFSAISSVNLITTKTLISLGADVNNIGAPNYPAIPLIAERDPIRYQDSLDVLKLLLKSGADINAQKMGKGSTGIMEAAKRGYIDTVRVLLENGADTAIGNNGKLMNKIILTGNYEMAILLIEAGTPIDFQDYDFWRMLKELVANVELEEKEGKPDIAVKLLKKIVEQKPTVNIASGFGRHILNIRNTLSNSDSLTVLNSLAKIKYINEQRISKNFNRGSFVTKRQRNRISKTKISIPKRRYSPEAKLHVVGVYKGHLKSKKDATPWWAKCMEKSNKKPSKDELIKCHRKHSSNHPERTMNIDIHAKQAPIILTLMSYEPTVWNINNKSRAKIDGIILSGYYGQRITGVPDNIPVDVFTYTPSDCGKCQVGGGHFFAYKRESERFSKTMSKLQQLTERSPSSFQGQYNGKSFSIMDN